MHFVTKVMPIHSININGKCHKKKPKGYILDYYKFASREWLIVA